MYWKLFAIPFVLGIVGGLIKGQGEVRLQYDNLSYVGKCLVIVGKTLYGVALAMGVLLGLVLPLKIVGCLASHL